MAQAIRSGHLLAQAAPDLGQRFGRELLVGAHMYAQPQRRHVGSR